jgi:hypothetical protein
MSKPPKDDQFKAETTITSQMVRAGVSALSQFSQSVGEEQLVTLVYTAMAEQGRAGTHDDRDRGVDRDDLSQG